MAIAAYLSGVSCSDELRIHVNFSDVYSFKNKMTDRDEKIDEGIYIIDTTRCSTTLGLTGASVSPGSHTYSKPTQRYLKIQGKQSTWSSSLQMWSWTNTSSLTGGASELDFKNTNDAVLKDAPSTYSKTWGINTLAKDLVGGTTYTQGIAWWSMMCALAFVNRYVKKDTVVHMKYYNSTMVEKEYDLYGGWEPSATLAAKITTEPWSNHTLVKDSTHFGSGWGVNTLGAVRYLNRWYDTISIMNTMTAQNYTYRDISDDASQKSSTAWDDCILQEINIVPDPIWTFQYSGTEKPLSSVDSNNSIYWSCQASKIQIPVNSEWSESTQLGTNKYTTSVKTFDEACPLTYSNEKTISGDDLEYTRTGYFIDSSGNIQTKVDNKVLSGDINFKALTWGSEDIEINKIALETLSKITDEHTFLGGGVPLATSPSIKSGVEVSLDYEVRKLNGDSIGSSDGDLNIKIELSNKQFKNGEIDTSSGGVSKGLFTDTVTYTNAGGTFHFPPLSMAQKSNLWLNAYVDNKPGYNVVISNIKVI